MNIVLILIVSLFFTGLVNRTKSIFSGRKGPGIFQPLKDIFRLLKKGSVYSTTSSFIFRIVPSVYFSTVLIAALFIPFGGDRGLISFQFDFVLFAYILALGKFFNIISALDTGSSFEGMGASREALYSMLAEPAFFITIGSLGLLTGYSSFYQIFNSIHYSASASPVISYSLGMLASVVFMFLGLVENSRIPIDDPKTHLELTMIHEVMILDNSGFDLGLILYTGILKFALYGSLIANMFFLNSTHILINIFIFFSLQALFALTVGTLESFMARFRMNQNPQFILMLSSVSLLIFLGVMIITGKI
ncbi:MAG: NADH-quinone oxidoreductase subunit H [Ignavibacteriaceae bacterium]|nr:NADH-quinone oxidoreductase subunit H [Ignavibacteriaceae bacterium]